jgi:hypothetical protein
VGGLPPRLEKNGYADVQAFFKDAGGVCRPINCAAESEWMLPWVAAIEHEGNLGRVADQRCAEIVG